MLRSHKGRVSCRRLRISKRLPGPSRSRAWLSSTASFGRPCPARRSTTSRRATARCSIASPRATSSDIDAAVKAARKAFDDGRWRRLHYREKKRILFRLAELMERDIETLAVLESLDVGKPISDALGGDIPNAIRTLRYYAEAWTKCTARSARRRRTASRSRCMSRSASSAPSCRGIFLCTWRCGKSRRPWPWATPWC